MNKKIRIIAMTMGMVGVVFLLLADAQEKAFTLKECYALALKRSETLAIAQLAVDEAKGQFIQSLSGVLPEISYDYSKTYYESQADKKEGKFTFNQPLFSGFKEFAAIAAAKAQGRQVRQEEIRARQLLFADVADAFYLYGFYQEHSKLTQSIIQALNERVEELKKRAELGRSRASELASAQARLRRVEAQVELARGNIDVARALLEFLTGVGIEAIEDKDDFLEPSQTQIQLTSYVERRPDVMALKEAVVVAQKKVAVARGGYWPSVNVEGNAYTEKPTAGTADMDVSLKVSVPIFDGADTLGKTKEAVALAKVAELDYTKASRQALTEIRQAYARWESSVKQVEALKKAVEAVEENYKLQVEDYRLSLVNNLDVLQALVDLEDVRRDYIGAFTDMKRFYWGFKVKTGDLSDVHF